MCLVSRTPGRLVVACPHCHGWEVRDQPLVQLGMRGSAGSIRHPRASAQPVERRCVLCTDGDELTADQLTKLGKAGVTVRTERVEAVHPGDDQVRVLLTTGEHCSPAPCS